MKGEWKIEEEDRGDSGENAKFVFANAVERNKLYAAQVNRRGNH